MSSPPDLGAAHPGDPAEPLRPSIRGVVENASFRRLWLAGALASAMRWLDLLVVGVFVFDLTDSALHVAVFFFFRMIPRVIFGVAIGTLADRVSRQTLLVVGFVALSLVSAALGALVLSGRIEYWHLLIGAFVAGIFWSNEFPVRRAMIGDVVPLTLIGRAVALDIGTSAFTRMLGPFLGGALLVGVGVEAAFFVEAVTFIAAALVVASLRYAPPVREGPRATPLRDVAEAFRYVRASQLLMGVFAVSFVMNLLAFPYTSMVPVIGRDTLEIDAVRIGLLFSAEGLGAVLGSALIAGRVPERSYSRIYYFGSMLYLVCVLLFSRSEIYPLSLAVLWVAGFGMTSFATMQTTLVVASAAPEMRGRALGALSISIGSGPLGALHMGVLAGSLGAPLATSISATEGIVVLALVGLMWPVLRRDFRTAPLDAPRKAV
jgi:MFS family permease